MTKKKGGRWRYCKTHRIGRNLTDITKGDVLPASVDSVSVISRAKIGRGDKDGLGDHQLEPRVGPIWRRGGTRGEMQGKELDPISRLETYPKKRKSHF